MSYKVFFSFSVGLGRPMTVPKHTLVACQDHVARVVLALGLKVKKYKDNPAHWRIGSPLTREAIYEASHLLSALGNIVGFDGKAAHDALQKVAKSFIDDKAYCEIAEAHNRWVRWLYSQFEVWSEAAEKGEPLRDGWHERTFARKHDDGWMFISGNYGKPVETEVLTPEDAQTFWHGLREIDVPVERWSRDYYVDRMNHVFRVLQGDEDEGVTAEAKPMTAKQAAAAIHVFAKYIDDHDTRLEVPNGHDYLAASDDGGYDWCVKCGPAHPDDVPHCRKKACPARAERDAEEPEYGRRWVLKDKAAGVYLGKTPGEWPAKLGKRVLHLKGREAAERVQKLYPKRDLAIVPVRPSGEWNGEADDVPTMPEPASETTT